MNSQSEKLVSICIPAYNHEGYIEETINSIINQTYENIELIIINDGSTDNTDDKIIALSEICKKRFKRFLYIKRENKGLLKTMKEFESLINGDYFSFVASDDFFHKTKTEKQVEILNNNLDFGMCYCNMVGIDKDSKVFKHFKTKKNKHGEVFDYLISGNFIPACSVMIRTEVFNDVGGFDLGFKFEDYPLWLKISHKYKIYYLNEELLFYRLHEGNMSKNLSFMIEEHNKVLLSWSNEPAYKKYIKKYYFRWFVNLAKSDDKINTKKYMILSLASFWWHPKFIKALIRYYFN